ncbi:MAG: carbon storage regulator CsrA [Spirochaetales bacterium]|nr:carbon storage regulator CsrA [Spirochaetales bacterium]
MLVLARRVNQSIMIGDEIEVVVVDIKGDQIKLGIRAPRNVSVHRSEVHKEIQEQNRQAAATQPDALAGLKDLMARKTKK